MQFATSSTSVGQNWLQQLLTKEPRCPIQAPCRKHAPVYRGIRHFVVHHLMVLFSHNRLRASKFWHRCFTDLEPSNSLGRGRSVVTQFQVLSHLYLRRSLLSICSTSTGKNAKRCPHTKFTDDYGLNCTMESWPSVLYSSGYGVGTRTSRKRSLRRTASSRLKKVRTGTPRTTKGPLASK